MSLCALKAQDLKSQNSSPVEFPFSWVTEVTVGGTGVLAPSFMRYSENILARRAPDLLFGFDVDVATRARVFNSVYVGFIGSYFMPDAGALTASFNEQQLVLSGYSFGITVARYSQVSAEHLSVSGFHASVYTLFPTISQTAFFEREEFRTSGVGISIGATLGFPLAEHWNTNFTFRLKAGFTGTFSRGNTLLFYSDNDGSTSPVNFHHIAILVQLGLLYWQ